MIYMRAQGVLRFDHKYINYSACSIHGAEVAWNQKSEYDHTPISSVYTKHDSKSVLGAKQETLHHDRFIGWLKGLTVLFQRTM